MISYKDILKSMPDTPGILGRDRYFNSVVFVPFLNIDGKCHILFQKRAENIRQGGEISFPGGRKDAADVTVRETAIRETVEELGIPRNEIIVDGQMDTLLAPMGAVVDVFIGRLTNPDYRNFPINRDEVEDIFVLPFDFFLENEPEIYNVKLIIQPHETDNNGEKKVLFPVEELELPIKYRDSWDGKKHEVYVYRTEYGIIWGLTAEILYDLVKRVK